MKRRLHSYVGYCTACADDREHCFTAELERSAWRIGHLLSHPTHYGSVRYAEQWTEEEGDGE